MDEIKIIKPPMALMVLPVIAGGLSIYYAKKKANMDWGKSILVGLAGTCVGSIPSWYWAYNINKQYVLQSGSKQETK